MIWFGLVWFYGKSTMEGQLMPFTICIIHILGCLGLMAYQPLYVIKCQILFIHIYQIYMIWFGLVWFYGKSTMEGHLMPFIICIIHILGCLGLMAYQPLYVIKCQILFIHIYKIYMIWFGWVLWHITHCRLFNAKYFLYMYIRYIRAGLVGFYGISIIVGYLMPIPFYTYTSNIWFLNTFSW